MNQIIHSETPASSMGSVALAIGAVMATGQAYWPVDEIPSYAIDQTVPSYSEVTERILAATKNPQSTFVDQMATIYAPLSQRQQLLGEEFEAAIFEDLDSLYES